MKVVHISPKKSAISFKPKERELERDLKTEVVKLPDVDPVFKETIDFKKMTNQETMTPVPKARLDALRKRQIERPKTAQCVIKTEELPIIQRRLDYTKKNNDMLYLKKLRQVTQFQHEPIESIYYNRTVNTSPSYEKMQTCDINTVSRKIPPSLNPRARPIIFF